MNPPFDLSHIHPPLPGMHLSRPGASGNPSPLKPQETYNGGYGNDRDVRLRVGNGGAGQSGLIRALADAFIQWRVEECQEKPFKVDFSSDCLQLLH